MDVSEIRQLVAEAKRRASDDQLGFIVIAFEYTEAGEARGHYVLGRVESREEAVELAGSSADCAYVLDEDELAFGLIPKLLAELPAAKAKTRTQGGRRGWEIEA